MHELLFQTFHKTQTMQSKKILITGAAGFIGFHAVKKLSAEGCEIVGIDNLCLSNKTPIKTHRLNELINMSSQLNFTFIQLDINHPKKLEALFSNHSFDFVFHFAAETGVRESILFPHKYMKTNVQGFVNVIDLCHKYKVKKFIYASSSSVYGLNSKKVFSENDTTECPISPYAASKKSNELTAYSYSYLHKVHTVGLRFFTVYGPWGRPDMFYFLFSDAIKNNKSISVFNHGNMKRDLTYIDDVTSCLARFLNYSESPQKVPYHIYNIGRSESIKLIDLIKIMENIIGQNANKIFEDIQEGDMINTKADMSLFYHDFGYKPMTDFEDGFVLFYDWYKSYKK